MAASESEFVSSPAFPPAPWHLQGEFFAVGGLMPIARAKAFVKQVRDAPRRSCLSDQVRNRIRKEFPEIR